MLHCCIELFTNGTFKMLEDFTSMDIDETQQIWFREERAKQEKGLNLFGVLKNKDKSLAHYLLNIKVWENKKLDWGN